MDVSPEEAIGASPAEQPIKKKRGRPPKIRDSGNAPTPSMQGTPTQLDQEVRIAEPAPKYAPPSATKAVVTHKRVKAAGPRNRISKAGPPLIPHVMVVQTGEDVVERLKDISRTYGRSVCVLAATGTLTSAVLMQVGQSGDDVGIILKTNGVFTVLSISGAVLLGMGAESGAGRGKSKSREPMTFLTASLANPTGGVVGGQVAGPLEASGPVTLVVGHWEPVSDTNIDVGGAGADTAPEVQAEAVTGAMGMHPLALMGAAVMEPEMPVKQQVVEDAGAEGAMDGIEVEVPLSLAAEVVAAAAGTADSAEDTPRQETLLY